MRARALLSAVVVVIVAGGIYAGLRFLPREAPPETTGAAPAPGETGTITFLMEQQWAIRMKLAKAAPETVARQITTSGRIVPAPGRHVVVAPPVSGILGKQTLPRVGQTVNRGQTLAVVRQTPTAAEAAQIAAGQAQIQIETTRLEAERRRLTEAVKEAEIRRNHAKVEFDRAQRLYDAKAYALRQVQAAEADYRAAESTLAAVVAQRDAVTAARTPAPASAAGATAHEIHAPIGGTVVRVAKGAGEQVTAGDAVLEILDASVVWIEVPVFERDLSRLGQQTRAFFTTPAAPGKEYTGRLIDAGGVVNRETRAVTVVFEVANPDRALRVGLQASVRLDADQRVEVLMVPREAILDADGKRFVYVLVTGEEFQRRDVVVGDEYGERTAILEGVKAGERVVTQGAYQMRQHELRPSSPGVHSHET